MKITWNWGTKLLVAMILFMLLIITMVYLSMQQRYDLVERDYYPKALEYQGRIDKTQNARELGDKIRIDQAENSVIFTYPTVFDAGRINGSIVFYRPSDEHLDVVFRMEPDTSGKQVCSIEKIPAGKYIVKFEYEVEGKGYYQEETVLLKMF